MAITAVTDMAVTAVTGRKLKYYNPNISRMRLPDFLKNQVILFLLKALGLYVLWYVIYEIWLHPSEIIDSWVIKVTLQSTLALLHLLGYHTFSPYFKEIGIDGTNGLFMGDNCNSIDLFALFAGFIIAFPGSWKKKL